MKHSESSGALPVAAIPPSLCVAEVRHGEFATSYRAGGQGRPVVLLAGAEPVPAAALLAGLVPRFRVLLPDTAGVGQADAHAFRTWLRGFLDGLGLDDVALVALPATAVNALAFALVEPGRVSRLALAALDAAATAAGPIMDRLVDIDTPLLLVRHDGSREAARAAAGAIIDFLAGDAP